MLLDYDKIEKYRKDLEKHKGLLPLYLITYIKNEEYINNLKKNNIFYNNIQNKLFERRIFTQYLSDEELIRFGEDELIDWLKDNPKYSDVVIDG